jgi:hypothetical protein
MISHPTFEAMLLHGALPPTNIPLRLAARQMRWLRPAFINYARFIEKRYGCSFKLDTTRLGTAFVRWLRALEHERRAGRSDRRQLMDFSASLMLQELVAAAPLNCDVPPRTDSGSPITIWPEGFTYTYFCITVLRAVLNQEFEFQSLTPRDKISDAAFWNSYRENCVEDHRIASGFFQMMIGYKPNWQNPASFRAFSRY